YVRVELRPIFVHQEGGPPERRRVPNISKARMHTACFTTGGPGKLRACSVPTARNTEKGRNTDGGRCKGGGLPSLRASSQDNQSPAAGSALEPDDQTIAAESCLDSEGVLRSEAQIDIVPEYRRIAA